MTFQDIVNFSDIKKTKHHKVAFAIPGLIGGFSYSILDGIEQIRAQLNMPVIRLYIYTWTNEENMVWVNAIEGLRKKYPFIEIHIKIEDPLNCGIIAGIGGLLDNLNIPYPGEKDKPSLDKYNTKRLVSLYTQYKLFQFVRERESQYPYLEEDNKTLIIKINTNAILDKKAGKIFNKSLNFIFHSLTKHVCTVDIQKIKHPYDILYTSAAGSNSISDKLYASSTDTLCKIFGNNDSEFFKKMFSIYMEYINKYPFPLKTLSEFEIFGKDLNYFPLEGSIFLKKLFNNSDNNMEFYSAPEFPLYIEEFRNIKNPWPEVIHGGWKYKKEEDWEFLKEVDKQKLSEYIVDYAV